MQQTLQIPPGRHGSLMAWAALSLGVLAIAATGRMSSEPMVSRPLSWWLVVPTLLVGGSAIFLGNRARKRPQQTGVATAAIGLGVAALATTLVVWMMWGLGPVYTA